MQEDKFISPYWLFCMIHYQVNTINCENNVKRVRDFGIIGDCRWTLTGAPGDYTLVIGGNCALERRMVPWAKWRDNIRTAVVQDGVSTIDSFTFTNCSSLTTVNIPYSVTEIDSGAFWNCRSLAAVSLPDSVTEIGSGAFWNCKGLTAVSIPSSVTWIGSRAFKGCSGLISVTIDNHSVATIGEEAFRDCSELTSVMIPGSVTEIGHRAFKNCGKLTAIHVDTAHAQYSSEDGVLFDKDKTTLLCYPAGKTGDYVLPNSVTTISDRAFGRHGGLTFIHVDVTHAQYSSEDGVLFNKDRTVLLCYPAGKTGDYVIPASVTAIGDDAFRNCNDLSAVIIPDSVMAIGDRAFKDCNGLTSVTIPRSVTAIGKLAFLHCDGLTSIRVDTGNTRYSSEDGVLFDKDQTTLVCYPAGKTGDYVIPGSITTIGEDAFSYCSGLTSVTILGSVTAIGNVAFSDCDGLRVATIPDSVTTIGSWAFGNCGGLTSVTIGNSVTTIGNDAFRGCSGLKVVTIPGAMTAISALIFYQCSGLRVVTIPASIAAIDWCAFGDCSSLSTVINLNPVPQEIDDEAFDGVDTSACMLKVPAGSVGIYRAAPAWNEFENIVALHDAWE
jgi:hypothetical protein